MEEFSLIPVTGLRANEVTELKLSFKLEVEFDPDFEFTFAELNFIPNVVPVFFS